MKGGEMKATKTICFGRSRRYHGTEEGEMVVVSGRRTR